MKNKITGVVLLNAPRDGHFVIFSSSHRQSLLLLPQSYATAGTDSDIHCQTEVCPALWCHLLDAFLPFNLFLCHDNLFSSFTGVKCTSLHIVFPPFLMGKINVLWVIKKTTLMSAWLFSSVFFFCVWVANLRWLPLHRDLLGCIILLDCSSLQWNAVFKNKWNLWLSSAVPLTPEVRKQALYAMRFVVTWGMLRTSVQHSSWL